MPLARLIAAAFVVAAFSAQAWGQATPTQPQQPRTRKPHESLVKVEDDPSLPRVLLIGDSISMGYTLPVRSLLKGKANLHRIGENGGPTTNGVAKIDMWLGDKKWDVIHFNWGLHDLRIMDTGKEQVSLADYETNLTTLVTRMKSTGAKLIWCTTTPVPEGSANRKAGSEDAYNTVALKIMQANGVVIDDLYAFAKPQLGKIQLPMNVHFSTEGSEVLAKQVATSILQALGK